MGKTTKAVAEDGTEIVYEIDGAGEPLLLIHGVMEDRSVWDALMPLLVEDYQVVRLDLRGHGQSGHGTTCDFAALAGDVAAVSRDLGIDVPHLVGHSLGGVVATLVAGMFGARSVVNVDQPFQDQSLFVEVARLEERLRGEDFVETLLGLKVMLGEGVLSDDQLDMLRRFSEAGKQDVLLALWEPLFQGQLAEMTAMFEAFLPTIRCPYLSLHGRTPAPGYRSWLEGLLANGSFALMTGLGHYPFLADPTGFVQRLRDFHHSQ